MLHIRTIMNSSADEILSFKGCCGIRAMDQNLEIHLENRSSEPVEVPSYVDLELADGVKRIETLLPSGNRRIAPGETIAFYCWMDEALWRRSRNLIAYDTTGRGYKIHIVHGDE
jgi:hypothetical protein